MTPGVTRIELFARERAEGWDSWGLELPPVEEAANDRLLQ